jgi:Domain of unknown function (DUF4440)
MRRILLFAVLAATIPLLSNGQTEPKTKPKPTAPASSQTGATEQALTKLDRELMDAVVRKDRTLFERTALTRFVFVNPGGGIEERADATEGPNIESIQTENVVVRVDGDTAVLTGKANLKGKLANGTDISGQYTYMRVFVKQKGQWRLAAMSAVPIAQAQPTPSSTPEPAPSPTPEPTPSPTPQPTPSPTPEPTPSPTPQPTMSPTPKPTPSSTPKPTPSSTPKPTPSSTPEPTPSSTP